MTVLGIFLWWGGIFLLLAVVCRMVYTGLLARLPLFSAYLGTVLGGSVGLLFCRPVTSHTYWAGYWVLEFVTAALSFGIVWEGYTEALACYPGARKMARSVLGILFAVVGAKTGVGLWACGLHHLTSTIAEFERDLRVFEVLSLVALAGLVVHYAIPISRNVLFMVIGYGLYLGVRAATLNLLFDQRLACRPWLSLVLQCAWNSAAVIWCVGMWSYSPTRLPDAPFECGYERTSEQTIRALGQIREYVVHCWRSP
jgi:hypothetical protein